MCDKRARPRLPFEFEREIRTVMPASVRLEAGDLVGCYTGAIVDGAARSAAPDGVGGVQLEKFRGEIASSGGVNSEL